MSVESAKAFYERILTDEDFRIQHRNAANDDERREMVLAAGYNFTPEEWEIVTTQLQTSNSAGGELSDAQLEAVSGGMPTPLPMFPMYGGPSPLDPSTFPIFDDLPSGPSLPK